VAEPRFFSKEWAEAVREALAAGRHVIASDVVTRPAGVEALPLRPEAWSAAIQNALEAPHDRQTPEHASNQVKALMEIYRSLLSS